MSGLQMTVEDPLKTVKAEVHKQQGLVNETIEDHKNRAKKAFEERRRRAEYKGPEDLYEKIHQFIYDHADLTNTIYYDILTSWILTTWRTDEMQECAYIQLRGPRSTGKTRTQMTLEQLCKNPLSSAVITAAAIFRKLNEGSFTFFLDEFDMTSKERLEVILGVLNSGYKKGRKAILCDKHDRNKVKEYDCFGPKCIATIKGVQSAFDSRCIHLEMTRNIRPVKFQIDTQDAQAIHYQIQEWSGLAEPLEDCHKLLYDAGIKDGRLCELFNALIAVTPHNKRGPIIAHAKELYEDLLEEDQTSLYKEIYDAITVALNTSPEQDKISVQAVADQLNLTRQDKPISNRKIGALLSTIGLTKKCRIGKNNLRGRKLNTTIIERLNHIYGPPQQTLT